VQTVALMPPRLIFFLSPIPVCPTGVPLTNNTTESFNRKIKSEALGHERRGMNRLVNIILRFLGATSRSAQPFVSVPSVNIATWRKAQQWATSKAWHYTVTDGYTSVESESSYTLYVPSARNTAAMVSAEEIETGAGFSLRHASLEAFKTVLDTPELFCTFADLIVAHGEYYIVQSADTGPFNKFTCSCPEFYKHVMCKNSLGCAIAMGLVNVPLQRSIRAIGTKPKRGRPTIHLPREDVPWL
jgi:hypothetical protein